MLAPNDITADSRVQKVALAASEVGYRVTVVGLAKGRPRWVETLGAAQVVRVPVPFKLMKAVQAGHSGGSSPVAALIKREETRVAELDEGIRARSHQAAGSRVSVSRLRLRGHQLVIKVLRVAAVLDRAVAARTGRGGGPDCVDEALESRKHHARIADYEHAYLAEIGQMDFDLVHAHDSTMVRCASRAVGQAGVRRERPSIVYDAHEYARGLSNIASYIRDVHVSLENQGLPAADAVVTVSPVLAERLQRDHSLAERPGLVLNTPRLADVARESRLSVRACAGLKDDVPLAVYAGVVKPLRGLDTAVRALPLLPELHLAVVVNAPEAPVVKELVAQAARAQCSERLHILPYVGQHEVVNHLRTADVGIYPLLRSGNTELAWPTKIFEYFHAGLPMVVSDMPSMAELVRNHGWGEVFGAGDHESFAAAINRVLVRPRAYDAGLLDELLRERFSWEAQARTLVGTYDRLLLEPVPSGCSPPLG